MTTMDRDFDELAAQAAVTGDRQARERAGDTLVGLVRAGGRRAEAAFTALCEAEVDRIFHYFALRVDDEQDALDLSRDLIARVRQAHGRNGLEFAHGVRSFYAYVYTAARRDVQRYAERRARAVPAPTADFDFGADPRQHTLDELAGAKELGQWLRQATHDIPAELDLVMLAYTQDLGREDVAAVAGIEPSKLDKAVHAAKGKVIDRLLSLYLVRMNACAELVGSVQWQPGGASGFTTAVYRRAKRHIKACETCRDRYEDARRTGISKDFLGIPIAAAPEVLRRFADSPPPAMDTLPKGGGGGGSAVLARLYSAANATPGLGRIVEVVQQNPAIGAVALAVTAVAAIVVPLAVSDPAPGGAEALPSPSVVATTAGPPASSTPTPAPGAGPTTAPRPSGVPAAPGNPTVSQPRWGYVYVNMATEEEAPIGTPTKVAPQTQWTTGAGFPGQRGREATVVHTGTGSYTVRMPDVANDFGIVHTTAYRTRYRARVCGVTGYRPDGPDELVDVRCFDDKGAPADWWFTLFFAAPPTGSSPYATIWYRGPGAGDGGVIDNPGTFNSAGRANRVARDGVGRYRAILEGTVFRPGAGYVQLTAFGGSAAIQCAASDTVAVSGGVEIGVSCHALTGSAVPVPADTGWLMSYVDGVGLARAAGTPAAYAMTTGDPVNPSIDRAHSYASNGEVPSVTRMGTGWYRLIWNNLGKFGDSVQVMPRSPGTFCHLGAINSHSRPPELLIDVYCHAPSGLPTDTHFGLTYLRTP
ncbi:RNA polymerase sigma factor [Allorhizocola rhizosphaerae]|uniref:RNA polymerase sigma factor n=1 Tax=Allorhizocola rhizosphaerae TaxID=1872709 RepID=UPI0013C2DC67|nr:hypothetical protein [Allorhizocola rhizosphaerae]